MSTVDITPLIAPHVWRDALERFDVQGVSVDDDGSFAVADPGAAVRTLASVLMVAHVEATLVRPSLAIALRHIAGQVQQMPELDLSQRREAAGDLVERLTDMAERMESP